MKYFLTILLLSCSAAFGQSVTTVNGSYNYTGGVKFSGSLMLTNGDTIIKPAAPAIGYKNSDHKVYFWNNTKWQPLEGGVSVSDGNNYVTAVSFLGNTFTLQRDGLSNLTATIPLADTASALRALNELNTLAKVVSRGYTAGRVALADLDPTHTVLSVQGHSSQTWHSVVVDQSSQVVFGVSSSQVFSLPMVYSGGGFSGNMFKNFGNYNSNLEMLFNEQGGINFDSTGYWRVVDNIGGLEMIKARGGKLYFDQLKPTFGVRNLVIKTTGQVDTVLMYTRAQVDSAIAAHVATGFVTLTGSNTASSNNTWSGTNAYTGTITVPSHTVGTANTQAATTADVKWSIDSTLLQIRLTSFSGDYHIPNSIATHIDLFVDPSSEVASLELYMPAAGSVKQHIKVIFGENSRISNGSPVVTEFNVYNSDGSTITTLGTYPASVVTGDDLLFTRNSFTNKWHEGK